MSINNIGPHTVIVGAGVVGLTAALQLRRAGQRVTVIDPLPSPGGASFGNAGMISPLTTVPIALPGMLRQVPGWLRDPLGPLAVRPSYFPRALPWLLKWIAAGRWSNVLAISDAMRGLHANAFTHWREILGPEFDVHFRVTGNVHVWHDSAETPGAARERKLRERQGIAHRVLTPSELQDLCPGITGIGRAIIMDGNGFTPSPARLVQALEAQFLAAGGQRLHQNVLKLLPRQGAHRFDVMTNLTVHAADNVVISAGARSAKLLAPLGISVPLEAERGYHVMIKDHGLQLGTTLNHKSRSFGMTPMLDGLRLAGTVEFAGVDALPDERRAYMLTKHLAAVFPKARTEATSAWMGMRPSLPDSLPVVDRCASLPGLYYNFGHSHFGMTGAPASARLLAALITGTPPEISPQAYSLGRPTLRWRG